MSKSTQTQLQQLDVSGVMGRCVWLGILALLLLTTEARITAALPTLPLEASFLRLSILSLLIAAYLMSSVFLKWYMPLLGLLVCFFGDQAPTVPSQLFDLLITVTATVFWLLTPSATIKPMIKEASPLTMAVFCILAIGTVSLVRLPLPHYSLFFLGADLAMLSEIFVVYPEHYLFPLGVVLRLWAFFLVIVTLNQREDAELLYTRLFIGFFLSAVLAAALALAAHFGMVSLYTVVKDANRLQGVFGHPGWFAEFVTVAIPFVLILFGGDTSLGKRIVLFAILIVCEIALILAQARAGWLTYPLTLLICWLFFYAPKSESLIRIFSSPKTLVRVFLSIPITILISLAFVWLLGNVNRADEAAVLEEQRREVMITKAERMFQAGDRSKQWLEGYYVGKEAPIWGVGQDSFRWFAEVLESIPGSDLHEFYANNPGLVHLPTPHNLYVSMFVSGGVLGALFTLLVVLFAAFCLWITFYRSQNLIALAALVSLISFHIYGVFQSMHYIGVVSFVFFASLGFACFVSKRLMLNNTLLSIRADYVALGCLFLTCTAGITYLSDINAKSLTTRYQIDSPPFPREVPGVHNYDFLGFYPQEQWDQVEEYVSWSRQKAWILSHEKGWVKLPIFVGNPDISNTPLLATIGLNGESVLDLKFVDPGWHYPELNLENSVGPQLIDLHLSRAFSPRDHGGADRRILGVAVQQPKQLRYRNFFPAEYEGSLEFRWSRQESSLCHSQAIHLLEFDVWTADPNVTREPLRVEIVGSGITHQLMLTSNSVESVRFEGFDSNCVDLRVGRTWSPGSRGSADLRELGVAVANIRYNSGQNAEQDGGE